MKIFGYDYVIIEDGKVDNIEAYGRYHARSQEIQIAKDLHPQQKQSTILHEIIEAINYHLQLNLKHNVIMLLEVALYQVLVDNKVDLSPLIHQDTLTDELANSLRKEITGRS